ncbi:MAG: hypothetical protein M1834_005353 [Cirrosporium novae-zelandiae]|nr:MAG: hypothetical protein M1834_005353 [Cirrosporium novae-zelandiae]
MATLSETLQRDPGFPVPEPTEAYWQKPPHSISDIQSSKLPSETSVAIIGSGITGASVAYHLLKNDPTLSITIFEARTATSGATGRNGGHIKDVPYHNYIELMEAYGKGAAIKITKFKMAQKAAVQQAVLELEKEDASRTELRSVESLDAIYDIQTWEHAKKAREVWLGDFPGEKERYGVYEAEEARKKFGMPNVVGILTSPQGAIWPYRFVTALLSSLLAKHPNMKLETQTPVTNVTDSSSSDFPYEITTPRGTILAKHVVHCTNGYVAHLLPTLRGSVVPLRGQMTVQSPPPDFPRVGATRSWSLLSQNMFDYMTQSPGPDGNIYLGGGFREAMAVGSLEIGSTNDSELSEASLDHLRGQIDREFDRGKGTEIREKWTGIMGYTPDLLPMVGKLDEKLTGRKSAGANGREWIAAGFCGHGMVYCWLSGKAVAEMLKGGEEACKDWFPLQQFACTQERLCPESDTEKVLRALMGR